MSHRTIGIVAPSPARSRSGNRVTALRWAALLRSLGHRVVLRERWTDAPCDLLVALHATKSAASLEQFARTHPGVPRVVALAGTDVYGELEAAPEGLRALELADRVIALQPLAALRLPERAREKVRVIYQSADARAAAGPAARGTPRAASASVAPGSPAPTASGPFRACVLAHLRPVKDPLRAALAARRLPASSRVEIVHVGAALGDELHRAAEREAAENPRYRWLGAQRRARALAELAASQVLVLASASEGGANAISEALALGVPVLASRIDGTVGVLGSAYPGYFEPGDTAGLARLLLRAECDRAFYGALVAWMARLAPLVEPARERRCWEDLLRELWPEPPASRPGAAPVAIRAGDGDGHVRELAADVSAGLSARPRRLACRWFYDGAGSRLFEEICELPEYYLTRAEHEILARAAADIAARVPPGASLVELGSGSAAKTRLVLGELCRRRGRLVYAPIDIAADMLAETSRALARELPELDLRPIAAEYEAGLSRARELVPQPWLVLWLGSNVGNFDRAAAARFLADVRARLTPADALLVGIDLRKGERELVAAYDDARGVTARFNRNLLARVNAELGGHFDLEAFAHRASWVEGPGRIEMHLISRRAQRVRIDLLDLEVELAEGEAIHTEDSYKYSPAEIDELARRSGFRLAAQWFDAGRRFSENLLVPA